VTLQDLLTAREISCVTAPSFLEPGEV
jgi:hypothetical protein